MSKTIVIMDAPDNATGIEQIGDENAYFLGAFGEVITVLRQAFPNADFSDPTEIIANTDKGKIKIEIAKHTPVQSFMMHFESHEVEEIVTKLCSKTNWRALDTDSGRFIDNKTTHSGNTGTNSSKGWWKLWKK